MASSLALRTAPSSIFSSIAQSTDKPRKKSTGGPPVPEDVSWQASGLTLQSLYGLANSLNTSDREITPVQAWFELASQYPLALLLRPDIVNALKRELLGMVKCLHYGALIERSAFESVVGRIVGPELFAAGPGPSAQAGGPDYVR